MEVSRMAETTNGDILRRTFRLPPQAIFGLWDGGAGPFAMAGVRSGSA
jgi:hypothetical protein